MAEGDIGAEIDRLAFDGASAQYPKIVHVAGDIFAIAYTGPDGDGWIQTVEIDSAGAIPAAVEGSLEFDATAANDIVFIKVTAGLFAVVYRDSVNDGWIRTLTISNDGTTLALTGESFEFETGACYEPFITKVADNIFAIAYRNGDVAGEVVTVSISNAGVIGDPILDSLLFDATRCIKPSIIHVDGDIYAIAFQGVGDDGWIVTVDIDSAGAIEAAIEDSLEFETTDISDAFLIRVASDIVAIAYKDAAGDGWIKTVSVDSAGVMPATIEGSLEFDTFNGLIPNIIPVSGDVYAVVYTGSLADGWLKTLTISDDGVTLALTGQSLEFDTVQGLQCFMVHVTGNIYAIVYGDTNTYGQIISVDIETVAAAAATHHLPLMGIG